VLLKYFFFLEGSACSRGNMQQMVQESVSYYSWYKLICNGNNTRTLVLQRYSNVWVWWSKFPTLKFTVN